MITEINESRLACLANHTKSELYLTDGLNCPAATKVKTLIIQLARSTRNTFGESLSGKFPDCCRNQYCFLDLTDTRQIITILSGSLQRGQVTQFAGLLTANSVRQTACLPDIMIFPRCAWTKSGERLLWVTKVEHGNFFGH